MLFGRIAGTALVVLLASGAIAAKQVSPATDGADAPTVEVSVAGEPRVTVRIDSRATVASLQLTDVFDGSIADAALALRALIRRLFTEHAISRVEILVPADDRRRVHLTSRTGLRREGILAPAPERA